MNDETDGKRTEDRSGLARFSAIQLAIAGLGCAVVVIILLLVASVLTKSG
jgi:hypothetical protein